MFKRSSIIKPTIDDIAKYASFNPKPALVGANGKGVVVIDEASGLIGTLRPRLQERHYLTGEKLYAVEFVLDNPSPFTELSELTKETYVGLRQKWHNFSKKHPYAAKAIKAGVVIGAVGGLMLLINGCGGSGGGSGGNDTGPTDITPPGKITDLAIVNPNGTYVEEIALRWTSPGDDGWTGQPSFFLVKYKLCPDQNDCPIQTESDWNSAVELGTVENAGSAGTVYSQTFPNVPPGHLCFAIRTYDEALNESGLSNSVCADVISKAEYYVDFWLPIGSIFLNYDEAVAMIQGEGDIPSYVSPIAAELVLCSNPSWPGTQADLENALLIATNGIYNPSTGDDELHIANDPWYLDNDGVGANDPGVRLYFEPDGTSVNDFNNISYDALRTIIREFLIQYVDAHREDYGNLCTDDPSCNPTWGTLD